MTLLPKVIMRAFKALAYALGASALLIAVVLAGRSLTYIPSVSAASSILYPHFCLGGWDHAQNASGKASLTGDDPTSAYTLANSAYLASSVSAQLFCGYFTSPEKTNPPTQVIITFKWMMGDGTTSSSSDAASTSDTQDDSLSSDSGTIIATSTGFNVQQSPAVPSASPSPAFNQASSSTSTDQSSASSTLPSVQDASSTQSVQPPYGQGSSTTPSQVPDVAASSSSSVSPPPVPIPPATDQAPVPAASSSDPSGFLERLIFSAVDQARAESTDPTHSNSPFLDVSYSLDGVRWVSIGTVGLDNWKGYTLAVPVSSWSDVNRLQIMIDPVPSLDQKPDIYLESMSVKIDYSRTVGEAVSDATAAVVDAMDGLLGIGDSPGDIPADSAVQAQPPAPVPQFSLVVHKKLVFAAAGAPKTSPGRSDLKTSVSSDGSSFTISGPCSAKYFVILVYSNASDYKDHPSSFVANVAQACSGDSFTYDLAGLSHDIPSGSYYIMSAEEGDTGAWRPVSSLYPITITASTTVETVAQ